jgi:hypothetical protein
LPLLPILHEDSAVLISATAHGGSRRGRDSLKENGHALPAS